MEVDERDLRILEILEGNARMPWRRLAKLLGVSEATIYLRIRRLEELGILRGFRAQIDPSRLGLTATVFILLKVEPRMLKTVTEKIKDLPFISEAHEITGDYQVLVKVRAPTQREAAKALEALAGINGVKDYASIVSLNTIISDTSITRIYKYWTQTHQPHQ